MSGHLPRSSSLKGYAGNTTKHCMAAELCHPAGRVHNIPSPPSTFAPHRTNTLTNRKVNDKYSSNGRAKITKEPTCSEDLHATVHTIDYKAGLDTFCFPTPSPKVSAVSPRLTPWTVCSTSQHSTPYNPQIGMAIGSPSHAPPHWGRSNTTDCVPSTTRQQAASRPPLQTTRTNRSADPASKQKKGPGWLSVGNFFRKPSRPDLNESFYALTIDSPPKPRRRAPEVPTVSKRSATAKPSEPSCLSTPSQQTPTKRLHKRSPPGSRARLASVGEHRSAPLPNAQARMVRSPRRDDARPAARCSPGTASDEFVEPREHKRHDSPLDFHRIALDETPSAPRLDCDIPRTQFERYSVMFSQLLLPDLPKSSLLERRQSRLSRRTSAGDISEDDSKAFTFPPRSSTPPPAMPPSMSISTAQRDLFTVNDTSTQRPQPIARSQTAPTGALWPLSATLVPQKPRQTGHSLTNSPDSGLYSEASLPPTPTTGTSCSDSDPAKSARTPTTSQTWSTNKPLLMTRDSLDVRSPPYPRIKSPADLERQIVQVSVARQVSVSRARTRVQQALPSKQPLRPRVVNLSFSGNRKSEVGLFEEVSCDDGMVGPMSTY